MRQEGWAALLLPSASSSNPPASCSSHCPISVLALDHLPQLNRWRKDSKTSQGKEVERGGTPLGMWQEPLGYNHIFRRAQFTLNGENYTQKWCGQGFPKQRGGHPAHTMPPARSEGFSLAQGRESESSERSGLSSRTLMGCAK